MHASSNGDNQATACERSSPAVQVRARESLIIVRYRFRRGAPRPCALVRISSPLSSSALTTPPTRTTHAPRARKCRVMARKESLGLLMAAATAAAMADQPKIGRPANPLSIYAMENVRTVPLIWLCPCLFVVCHHTAVPCAVFVPRAV